MSLFEKTEKLPADPILGLSIIYAEDTHEKKVNLGIGTYKNEKGKPVVLSSVKKAEDIVYQQQLDKEYLPIEGGGSFLKGIIELIYGKELPLDLISAVQTIGGTSALRVGAEFLLKQGFTTIYLSEPSWPNHKNIFQKAGMIIRNYPYYDYSNGHVNFEALCQAIKGMDPGNVIVLQASCHNPTGVDPTQEQWKILSEMINKQKVIPFFDFAYQGLGLSVEQDAWPIRYFASQKKEMFVASSYSKNFGLYGERVGSLSWQMLSKEPGNRVLSQIKQIVRGMYSSPPLHGERLITTILNSKELRNDWLRELEHIRSRIIDMRQQLMEQLNNKKLNRDFQFMEQLKGMFFLSGLTPDQVERIRKEYGIYMLSNGRISVPGLTNENIDYVADSIATVLKKS